jgi:hypothetical protein
MSDPVSPVFTGRLRPENAAVTARCDHGYVDVCPQLRRLGVGAAGLAAALLVAAGPALADHGKSNGHGPAAVSQTQSRSSAVSVLGVVQSVTATGVSVKRLDGSSVTVPVDRNTKVTIDGKPARLTDVKPGSVLSATWQAGKPATMLRFVRPS